MWWGFYKAFKHLGHEVYWFDDSNYPSPAAFDYNNSVFLCESYQCHNIPIKNTSTYFVHTYRQKDFIKFSNAKRVIDLAYNVDYQNHPTNYQYVLDRYSTTKLAECVYFDQKIDRIYISWATDLLPQEIDLDTMYLNASNDIFYIGTIYGEGQYTNLSEIDELKRFCADSRINFIHIDPWLNPVSLEENRKIIQNSYLAPDIRGQQNIKIGYIPCRIFKNISYGQLGITNSRAVHNLLEEKTVFHPDVYNMMSLAMAQKDNFKRIRDQRILVKEKHTFVERIQGILKVI